MDKAIEALKRHLASIRTGRAHASLLDGVSVDYYGTVTPLNQVATINVPEPRTLVIKPWEKSLVKLIEKAILEANLGLMPTTDSDMLRINMPQLTEERRKEFVKQAQKRGEEAKVAIRNARRDANDSLKDGVKKSILGEDEEKRGLKTVQDATDASIAQVDALVVQKEKELMTI
jgi:ribosome recycling factor